MAQVAHANLPKITAASHTVTTCLDKAFLHRLFIDSTFSFGKATERELELKTRPKYSISGLGLSLDFYVLTMKPRNSSKFFPKLKSLIHDSLFAPMISRSSR